MTGSGPNAPQSLVGRVARVWANEPKSWINQRVGRLILKNINSIHSDFLYYVFLLKSSQEFLVSNSSGSANQANISGKLIESLPCPDVNYEQSKKISRILKSLDEKIILNNKTNETLEKLAQALFKSWFVDFDPVKAKEKLKQEGGDLDLIAKELGMSKEILELFPDEFEESELGLIPNGWSVKPFGKLIKKTIGGDWGKEAPDQKHTKEVKILRGTDLPKVYRMDDSGVPIRYVEEKKLKTRIIEEGDIIIEVSGGSKNQPTGRSLYFTQDLIDRLGYKLEPASFCRLFKPATRKLGLYLGLHLMKIYDDGKTWLYQNQSTGISNFQTTMFLEKEVIVVPEDKVFDAFYRMVEPMFLKIHSSESKNLVQLRDTLLPKLLSGEISINNLETNEAD